MSEKIYACLLRLFPLAFRRRYGEESLRLLRDRLNHERGFPRRLRLGFELITDMITALPRAYRNSYADVTAAASISPHLDGVPSFQPLRKEPFRPEAFIAAGVLTLTALVTFTYVMRLPMPIPAAGRIRPRSPIEAVLERLNKPLESADNPLLDGSESASSSGRPEARPVAKAGSALPQETRFVSSAMGQPVQTGEPTPTSSNSNLGSLRIAATPSSSVVGPSPQPAQNPLEGFPAVAQNLSPSSLEIPVAVAANLSGTWTESSRGLGADAAIPRLFIFNQHGAALSGTGGSDFAAQYPIINGHVAGDSVRFEVSHEGKRFFFDLRVEGKQLRGTLSIRTANKIRIAAVQLERNSGFRK